MPSKHSVLHAKVDGSKNDTQHDLMTYIGSLTSRVDWPKTVTTLSVYH